MAFSEEKWETVTSRNEKLAKELPLNCFAVKRHWSAHRRCTRTFRIWPPQGPPSAPVLYFGHYVYFTRYVYFRRCVAAVSEASVSAAASPKDFASLKDLASSSESICSMSSKMRRRSSSFATLETNPDFT